MNTLFFRLLDSGDKAAALSEAIDAMRAGHVRHTVVYAVDPASFRQVPGSPFAYWVSNRLRRLFQELARAPDNPSVASGIPNGSNEPIIPVIWGRVGSS